MKNLEDVVIKALDQVTTYNYLLLEKVNTGDSTLKTQNLSLMKEIDKLVEENTQLKKDNDLLSKNIIKDHENIFHSPPF